ncbi:MAG: hypothetical protein JXP72_05200 [Coriobacteriia bacterium]|nr:hypothetical protein [Coriobacteriia bacterium]
MRTLCRAACALALGLTLVTPHPGLAAPATTTPVPAPEQSVSVELRRPAPAITPADALRVDVAVDIAAPAEYLEVRLRLYSPSGRLVYQKTEVRAEMPAGRHVVGFDYDLARLALPAGRYPIEIRVLATGSEPTLVTDRLLIVDESASRLPVSILVRIWDLPATDAEGRFMRDPAQETRMRDDLAFVTQLALDRGVSLAVAMPPLLLEELSWTAGGYETTAGVSVAADTEVPGRYARALTNLRSAIETGAITLLDVPYALPDLDGLMQARAETDIVHHWAATDATLRTLLDTGTAGRPAFVGCSVTPDMLTAVSEREAQTLIIPPTALRSEEGTVGPGVHSVPGSEVPLLALDMEVSESLRAGPLAFYDALYDRLGTVDRVVITLDIGHEGGQTGADVGRAVNMVSAASWLRLTPLDEAVSGMPIAARLRAPAASGARDRYWETVREGRTAARAFSSAFGAEHPEAYALRRSILVAESALWAGPTGSWTAVDTAEAFAITVGDAVIEHLSQITVGVKDVTLSGSRGDVPLTLTNTTGTALALTIVASSDRIGLPTSQFDVTAEPADNFLTIPVDLGAVIADDLTVTVRAGDLTIAESTVRVRSSHIDRLATVGMVVLVLLVLLLFIRRRVRTAIAGTIAVDDDTGR